MFTSVTQRLSSNRGRDFLVAMLMGGPAFLLLFVFMVWPFIRGINLSTTSQRFDGGAVHRLDPWYLNYDNVLSVNVIRLPDVPVQPSYTAPSAGWYRAKTADCKACEQDYSCKIDDASDTTCATNCQALCEQGELIFRWRARGLEEVGLARWKDYEIARTFSVGNRQYAVIAKDPLFWKALLNNFYFALIVVPIQTALALLLAILVN
jgi:multiple sugar transport system permease protein